MSLRFVLGASGSGKSYYMYQWMIEQAMANPQRQYIILVPDQYTMQIQKEIVAMHPGHAIINVDVLSFSRLYHRVMAEVGGDELTPLDDTGKNLIIRRLAGELKEELPVLGRLMDKQGYISEIKSIISEMQQYGISPEGMQSLIQESGQRRGLQARLEDVQKLYRAYMTYQEGKYLTGETMYPILTARLKESALFQDTVVFLDGFTGFTPVQMPLVQEIMVLARETYVAITMDEEPDCITEEQQLFYTSAKTIRDLEKLAERARVMVEPYGWREPGLRFTKSAALAHLERNLFRSRACGFQEHTKDIVLWNAPNPRQESFALAREVKRLVRKAGYQYRDIAVICGDMGTYREHLQEAMEQMELPYFVDAGSKILHNPAMELMQGLLEMLERDFSYGSVMRYLRSGFTGLSREEVDLLEIYLIETGIRGRRAFLRPFTRKGKEYSLEVVNALRERMMEGLAPCLFEKEEKTRVYIEKLYTYLTGLGVEQKLHDYSQQFEAAGDVRRSREYRQIYRKLMDLFNQVVVLMGDEVLSIENFASILRAGFEELQVGLIPAKVDQVLIGDMERTRLNRTKVLFVVGVNDCNIPGSNTKGGMISDMDREYLGSRGLELAPTTRQLQFRQRFYLYQQLTKPSERLYLSYAHVDSAEKELRPSYFMGVMRALFPMTEVQSIPAQMIPEHISELWEQSAEALRKYVAGSLKREECERLYTMLYVLKEHQGGEQVALLLEQAFFEGGGEKLDADLARALYGSILYGSISRLEQYASCPYGHFLKYGLGIREPQEYILESADLGNIFHDVLDDFGRNLTADGYSWSDFPEAYGDAKVVERLALIKEEYGDELLLDKARNGYALSRAERILKRSIRVLKEHMRVSGFRTYAQEMTFEVTCQWNATNELMMRLRGRIDRLDVAAVEDDMYVKVIDYKSGSKTLQLDCMYAGLQLQLLVYMDMACKRIEERNPQKNIHPAAMFYYRVADPVVEMNGAENYDGLSDALLRSLRTSGMLNSDETVVYLLDKELETESKVVPFKLKKDGTPASGSSVCSEEQFELMRRFINHKLYQMGSEIVSGHIEKAPYIRNPKEHGCLYCPYKGVCGFDERQYGYRKRPLEAHSEDEVWWKMEQDLQEAEVINGNSVYEGPTEGH